MEGPATRQATAQERIVKGHIRSEADEPSQGDATAVVDLDGRIGFVTERVDTDGQYTLSINEGILLNVVAKSDGYVSSEQRAAGLETPFQSTFCFHQQSPCPAKLSTIVAK